MPYGSGKYTYELVEWAKLPPGLSFLDVGGISTDAKDNVYVLNRSQYPIMVFDREGNLIKKWGEGFFNRAHGSTITPDGYIWCTDDRNHIVAKFDADGKVLMTLGTKGQATDTGYVRTWDFWESLGRIVRAAPPFNRPTGVALNSRGEIFIADGYGNAAMHKFSADGKFILTWGAPGGRPGEFRLPHNCRVDKKDHVWVADRENHRLQIFDSKGKFLGQWTDFVRPTDCCFDKDGMVYVSELSMRVSVWTPDGKLVARWGNPGLNKEEALFIAPHAVAVDSRGDLYVGEVSNTFAGIDKGARTIQKFVRVK